MKPVRVPWKKFDISLYENGFPADAKTTIFLHTKCNLSTKVNNLSRTLMINLPIYMTES